MENDVSTKPPIRSGWRGEINGHLDHTSGSYIEVSEITLKLDRTTAYGLANLLTDGAIERSCALEADQAKAMSNLGAALGRMLDHHAANNGGRKVVKSAAPCSQNAQPLPRRSTPKR